MSLELPELRRWQRRDITVWGYLAADVFSDNSDGFAMNSHCVVFDRADEYDEESGPGGQTAEDRRQRTEGEGTGRVFLGNLNVGPRGWLERQGGMFG